MATVTWDRLALFRPFSSNWWRRSAGPVWVGPCRRGRCRGDVRGRCTIRGEVLRDVAVAVALGGDCSAGVGRPQAEPAVLGPVASDLTACPLLDTHATAGLRAGPVRDSGPRGPGARECVRNRAKNAALDVAGEVSTEVDGVLVP